MNTPIDETIPKWAACAPGSETWHNGDHSNWWGAAIEYAEEQCWKCDPDGDMEIEIHEELEPKDPTLFISASRIIDMLDGDGHEHYSLDCCDDWPPETTQEQDDEIEAAVAEVVRGWLKKHNLNPAWKVGGRRWVVTYRQAVERARQAAKGGQQ